MYDLLSRILILTISQDVLFQKNSDIKKDLYKSLLIYVLEKFKSLVNKV